MDSENAECTTATTGNKDTATTMEDTVNANTSASSPTMDKNDTECRTVSNNNSWGSWGSWISSAKTKSVSVFEAVKRDLDEISTAVRTEVTHAGSVIGETLKFDEPESTASTVKKSLSSFFEQVSEALVPSMEDDESEVMIITSEGAVTLTGFQKHLAELQANEATYLTAPDATLQENYQRWLEIVDQNQFTQNQLARQLTGSEILNEKYLNLVPEKVPHMEFWKRYLFKRALLEDACANAEQAERRAKAEVRSTKTVSPKHPSEIIQTHQPKAIQITDDDDNDTITNPQATASTQAEEADELVIEDTDVKWGADDFGNEDISEEEQARLLEQYEAEINEREKRKSQVVPLEEKSHPKGNDKNQTKQDNKKQQQTKSQPASQKSNQSAKKSNTTKSSTTVHPKQVENNTKTKSNPKSKSATESISSSSNGSNPSLKMQKDHFDKKNDTPVVKERSLAEDLKTDAGAASDESWEKDFDLSDH